MQTGNNNQRNGGTNPSTGGNEPQTQYTVTVIRSYDAGVIKTYTVNAGDTLRTNDIEFDNYDGWVARRLKCSADDLKNIQSNLIVAVEYYKASEVVTEYGSDGSYFGIDFDLGKPVWHESIVRPTSGSGPVTIKNNNNGSSIVLEREDPSPSTTAKVDLSKVGYTKTIKALPKNGFAYNGKAIGITKYRVPYYEKDGKAYALNYKVSYTRNDRIGTATATFTPTDKSKFTGTVKTTFRIVPKKPAFKTVKMTKSTSQIKVKAVKGGVKYQYQIRLKNKGKWKTVNSKKTTYKFTKLKGKKLYQIRVRAYKKVGKQSYYSPWNTIKLKTVKKTKKFR